MRIFNLFKRKQEQKKFIIGHTLNCVNCGKVATKEDGSMAEGCCGCGNVVKDGNMVIAYWCSDICLRDMHFKYHNWCGMAWIEQYGIHEFEKPIEI